MNTIKISQLDNLNAEYRILKAECARQERRRRTLTKWAMLGPVLGISIGAFGMVYLDTSKPQPVVVEIEKSVVTPTLDAALEKLKTSLEVHFIRQEAMLTKMQQDNVKLSTINKARAAQLIEREPIVRVEQDGAGVTTRMPQVTQQARDAAPLSIQQMAKDLGVMKMVVK